jgi:hypothetical protein
LVGLARLRDLVFSRLLVECYESFLAVHGRNGGLEGSWELIAMDDLIMMGVGLAAVTIILPDGALESLERRAESEGSLLRSWSAGLCSGCSIWKMPKPGLSST